MDHQVRDRHPNPLLLVALFGKIILVLIAFFAALAAILLVGAAVLKWAWQIVFY